MSESSASESTSAAVASDGFAPDGVRASVLRGYKPPTTAEAPVDQPAGMRERARARRHRAARTNIKSIRFLRTMAVAEATAFLTLLTVGILHAVTGGWGWELFVMGNVHGAIFTTYCVSIVIFHRRVGWGPLMLLLVLLAGFVPGGGLMVERWALAAPGRD